MRELNGVFIPVPTPFRGDGIAVPYYWAWVPAQAYIAAPPPPAVPAEPDMTPAGSLPPPPPPAAG